MHHSRISTLMIDCLDEHFEESLAFWAGALGLKPRKPGAGQRYVTLGPIPGPLFVRVQRVGENPGYHLDIETDDRAAESRRMEMAGARSKYRIKTWRVLEDPSGNPFCLIRPESGDFPASARRWE